MPSFTTQLPDLQATGPLVEMHVGLANEAVEALKKNGTAIPNPVSATALIDTGATASVIHPDIVKQLGLKPVGVANVCTASADNVKCLQYAVLLMFANGVGGPVIALEAPLKGQQIQCLIGRDVLSHAVMIYNGYMKQFTLSF